MLLLSLSLGVHSLLRHRHLKKHSFPDELGQEAMCITPRSGGSFLPPALHLG